MTSVVVAINASSAVPDKFPAGDPDIGFQIPDSKIQTVLTLHSAVSTKVVDSADEVAVMVSVKTVVVD